MHENKKGGILMKQTARTQDLPPVGDGPMAQALETLTRLTSQSGQQLQNGLIEASVALTRAAGSMLEEAKLQSRKVARSATREIQEHPIATTAPIILASAAIVNLLISLRKSSDASPANGLDEVTHQEEAKRPSDRKKQHKDS